MTRIEALQDLLKKVEVGDDVNALIFLVENFSEWGGKWDNAGMVINNGSLDAAKALDKAIPTSAIMDDETAKMILFDPNGARVWLAWKLKALIAKEQETGE